LTRCEFIVNVPHRECGELAAAFWQWGDHGSLFVCELHDKVIEKQEIMLAAKLSGKVLIELKADPAQLEFNHATVNGNCGGRGDHT
jgi:hypothetical protein